MRRRDRGDLSSPNEYVGGPDFAERSFEQSFGPWADPRHDGSVRSVLLILGAGILAAALVVPLVAAQDQVPSCVHVRGRAVWGASAYNHIVSVENGCTDAVSCEVATDVTPASVHVRVPASETRETVTFIGSPAREFTTRVRCEQER